MRVLEYVRRHHVAALALVVAMSGTAYAASLPRNSVGNVQLKANAVTSAKIKNGAVRQSDLAPPLRRAGGHLSGPMRNLRLRPRVVGPAQLDTPLSARVTLDGVTSSPATAASGVQTLVPFEVEEHDTAGLWDPAQPDRLTIPRTGLWLLTGQVHYGAHANGIRLSAIRSLSGGPSAALLVEHSSDSVGATSSTRHSLSATTILVQGDTVGLTALQTSGASLSLEFGGSTSWISAVYLGPVPAA